jgi:hypothetical protein
MDQFKFIWKHQCHGLLGVFKSMDELKIKIKKSPYPHPNTDKMEEQLSTNDEFSYAIGLLTIKRVPITVNPKNIF